MDDGGIGSLNRRFEAIPDAVRDAVKKAVLKQAEKIAADMKAIAPRDTGALIESIAVTGPGLSTPPYSEPGGSSAVPDNAAAITAGNSDVRYPHLVEYGTGKAHAQPFFWPAVRGNKAKAARNIKSSVTRAIKKNWGKP